MIYAARAGEGYFSADGRRMIFQSERAEGNPFYQIYLMDLETGDIDRLSPGYGKTTCGWIHPDGTRALFASTQFDPEGPRQDAGRAGFPRLGPEPALFLGLRPDLRDRRDRSGGGATPG